MKSIFPLILVLLLASTVNAQVSAPRIVPVVSFTCDPNTHLCPNGAMPGSLIQASDGSFYGSTSSSNDGSTQAEGGSIFKMTPSGLVTVLFTFRPNQRGDFPNGNGPSLFIEGNDGFLYGITGSGGSNNDGLVFKISKTGAFRILHSFCSLANCADGSSPSGLILGSDGTLYGSTRGGGSPSASCSATGGCGTIFGVTQTGAFSTLHVLEANEGRGPLGLIQASDGNFYGTTSQGFGGTLSFGAVFRFTSAGAYTILYNIRYPQKPLTSLVQAIDGNFYGATAVLASQDPKFIFNLSPSGHFQNIYQLTLNHGGPPLTNLMQASDGNLWGAAENGGMSAAGTIFTLTPGGAFLQALSLGGLGGSNPGSIFQSSDGTIYGTAGAGGSDPQGNLAFGTVYRIDAGLPAQKPTLAAFAPASGKALSQVTLRGNHFVGTSAVTFNGVKATFKVLNVNFISVTVPQGATSGHIVITNRGGTATSPGNFIVQ